MWFNNMAVICHYVRLSPLQKEKRKEGLNPLVNTRNKKGFLHMNRLKQRFLSAVAKKETSYKLKFKVKKEICLAVYSMDKGSN